EAGDRRAGALVEGEHPGSLAGEGGGFGLRAELMAGPGVIGAEGLAQEPADLLREGPQPLVVLGEIPGAIEKVDDQSMARRIVVDEPRHQAGERGVAPVGPGAPVAGGLAGE